MVGELGFVECLFGKLVEEDVLLVEFVGIVYAALSVFQRETVVDRLLHESVDVEAGVDDGFGPFSVVVQAHQRTESAAESEAFLGFVEVPGEG